MVWQAHPYAQYLVDNKEAVADLVSKTRVRIKKEFGFTDDERYWLAGCTCLVAGALLAGSNYAGIVDYPIEGIVKVLKGMVATPEAVSKTASERLRIFLTPTPESITASL
jgi:hypothetical protein